MKQNLPLGPLSAVALFAALLRQRASAADADPDADTRTTRDEGSSAANRRLPTACLC